jgi:large subunit ribosomal protein L24
MKIRRDDQVKVLSGKDKGKKGKVVQVFPREQLIVVEGVNKMYKHMKSPRRNEKGQKIEFNGPIHVSNVMLIDKKTGKPTRIGFRHRETKDAKGKASMIKERVAKKSKEVIE